MQQSLLEQAHARRTDPSTSHEAAASVRPETISRQKQEILAVIGMYGPLTDEGWIEVYRSAFPHSIATDQSLRSRRSELVTEGKVFFSGDYGRTHTGAKSRCWAVKR